VIYTTNAIESVNAGLRKNVKPAGDDVAMKPTWPVLCNVGSEWSRAPRGEEAAMNRLAILCAERFTARS
jgi:transposase-like protein